MSHDHSRHDNHHGNHHDSETPHTNGLATTVSSSSNHIIGKLHSAQSMDGTAEYESRTAHITIHENDNTSAPRTGPAAMAFSDSSPQRRHHRNHSDTNNIATRYPGQQPYGQMPSVIGPSMSVPDHLGNSKIKDFIVEEPDGGMVSKSYDVTPGQSDRRRKESSRQPNVELLTYKPTFDSTSDPTREEDQYEERFVGETDMTLSQQETATEIDTKITEMVRQRKISQGTRRTPKATVLPTTKETMKEVMNMAPEKRKKKTSRSELKRLERNTVHEIAWEPPRNVSTPTSALEREEITRREREALKKDGS